MSFSPCSEDYTYYVQKFCFNEKQSYYVSIFAGIETCLEILVGYIFVKKCFQKIRKIKNFDENDKNNKTYCLMSLWIV